MPTLRETQARFAAALLGDGDPAATGVRADGLDAAGRVAVYRHHVLTSLTAVLESTYPVVARLVDPRFFRFAADRYIRKHPPTSPCLFEYGATLPDFLDTFEPSRHLAYLPDVARLEWALNAAVHAADRAPIEPESLRDGLAVSLHPSVTLLHSAWPIDAIWRVNQAEAARGPVDLQDGGVRLQVWRLGDDAVFRTLSPGAFAFRRALAHTRRLDEAAGAALSAEPGVHLARLVREMLDEAVLVDCRP
jgi:hypothetical protein